MVIPELQRCGTSVCEDGGSYLGSGRSDSRPAVWQLETWRHTGCTGRGPSERRSPPGAWPLHALKKEPKRLWRRQTRTEMLDKIKKERKERRNKGGWVYLQAAFCSFDPRQSTCGCFIKEEKQNRIKRTRIMSRRLHKTDSAAASGGFVIHVYHLDQLIHVPFIYVQLNLCYYSVITTQQLWIRLHV